MSKKKKSKPYLYQKEFDEFRQLWIASINKSVEYGFLKFAFNDAISRGFNTDYILFVLRYCIDNRLSLHYPAGFKYFLDKPFIKQAYEKEKSKKKPKVKIDFSKMRKQQSIEPSFTAPDSKPKGFNSIFDD